MPLKEQCQGTDSGGRRFEIGPKFCCKGFLYRDQLEVTAVKKA